jgi:hypothetical protein
MTGHLKGTAGHGSLVLFCKPCASLSGTCFSGVRRGHGSGVLVI